MVNSKAISSMIAIISFVLIVMGLSGSFLFWNVATSETFKTTVQSETQRAVSPASTGFEIVDVDFVENIIKIKNSGYNVINSDYIYIFLNGSLSDAIPDKTEINPGEILTLNVSDPIENYDIMITGPHGTSDEFYTGLISCGNGVVELEEECEAGVPFGEDCTDFGYFNPGGLSCTNCQFDTSGCMAVCGNGPPTEPGEVCDDGDLNVNDSCPDGPSGTCQSAFCGDGFIWNEDGGTEECDDGGTTPGDGCDENCKNEVLLFCSDCASCTAAINSANPEDVVILTANIIDTSDSPCIDFNDTDNVTFNCNGNTIDSQGGGTGILLGNSSGNHADYNTIRNCYVSDWNDGIVLNYSSSYNNIFNVTSTNNNYGFVIDNSNYNIIKDSRIEGNGLCGIRMDDAGLGGANWIYNNIFNNTNNVDFQGTVFANSWNFPSPATGPNIVGGPYIAGNYWTNSTGNGYSDTCTESGHNGYCYPDWDVYNKVTCLGAACSSNTDHIPLSKYCGTNGISMYGICWYLGETAQNCTTVCSNHGLTCYDPDWSLYVEDCNLHAAFGLGCSPCFYRPDPVDPSKNAESGKCYYTNSSSPPRNFDCGSDGIKLRRICPCQ